MRWFPLFLLPCLLAAVSIPAAETKPLTAEQLEEHKLDASFYKKGTVVEGILIATSERVSDHTHAETAYLFEQMMQRVDPAVAQRVREREVLCLVLAHDELTSDMPQFKTDKTGEELDFYNWRQRGFLRWPKNRPVVLFAEEDVMEYEGGMQIESILIHEFAHVIHGAGFDAEQQRKLTEAYRKAMAAGRWQDGRAAQRFRRVTGDEPVRLIRALRKAFPDESPALFRAALKGGDILVNGEPADPKVMVTGKDKVVIQFGGPKRCYAGSNRHEYWAEGFQSWYDTNRTMDHDHNHINTRAQLKTYDPDLAALCEEILGDTPWVFVSPRERAGKDHPAKTTSPATIRKPRR